MDLLRTPDERFADLPGWDFAPHDAEVTDADGNTVRMAYVDEGPRNGAAPVVLLMHGEPTWSYLYRHMVPPLVAEGFRVVVPDLVGFGRSDKPTRLSDHTYARHVAWTSSLVFGALDLHDVTLFCQDWGGLIALRLVAAQPDRFARVIAANTGMPDGEHRLGKAWWAFHDFVQATEDLPVGFLVRGGCARELSEAEVAAYEAPFPDPSYKIGPRALPGLIPQSPDDVETPRQQEAWESLRRFDKPFLTAFSDSDPITKGGDGPLRSNIPGTQGLSHPTVEGASHFLQEDAAPVLVKIITDFVHGGFRA